MKPARRPGYVGGWKSRVVGPRDIETIVARMAKIPATVSSEKVRLGD
jgi:hypothetical protein